MNELFQAYCNYGTRAVTTELDGAKFVKIFKDCGLVGKGLIATDLDIIYSKVPIFIAISPQSTARMESDGSASLCKCGTQVKTKGTRKIQFAEFTKALDLVASKKVRLHLQKIAL